MKTSKKNIVLYIFSIIGIIFIFCLLIGGYIKKRSLDRNLRYSKAIVIDNFRTIKYTNYFGYKFLVDEKEYYGSGKYYPKSDSLSIGDTIVVVYDKTNPSNNETYKDYK